MNNVNSSNYYLYTSVSSDEESQNIKILKYVVTQTEIHTCNIQYIFIRKYTVFRWNGQSEYT